MKLSRAEIAIITDALACKVHDIDKLLTTNARLYEAREARGLYAADWRARVERLQERRSRVEALRLKLVSIGKV